MRSSQFSLSGLAGILCSRAEVYTLLGRGNEALTDLERVDGLAGEMKPMDARKRLQGRLHVRRGEGARAWAAFREAMTIFKDIREEYELGKACYYYAQGLSQLVGAREAEWYRVQAREIFARLGARGWLRKMGEGQDM